MFVDAESPTSIVEELDLGELDRQICELAAHINAATCRWLGLVAEFDRRAGHERFGFASCSSWLAWRCSITPRAAREQLRVARSLRELPRIRSEFSSGALSYSKVRALTRVAEPEMEPELTELAREATAAQLERLMRGYRAATSDPADRAAERRRLTLRWDDDGNLAIRGCLPADEGAQLLKALGMSREALARDGADSLSDADALMGIAETAVSQGVTPTSGGDRHQVVVHVDAADLAAREARGGAGSWAEGFLPAETVRRLACDASVVTLVESDGVPLSVGRKRRSVPPAIARALRARDGGCRFPGCERKQWVDAHHITHWAHGGETSLDNLVQLCRHHHRLVHDGGFTVQAAPDGPVFRRPGGTRIETVPPATYGSTSRLVAAGHAESGALRPADCRPRSAGQRMDLDLAVLTLAEARERRKASPSARSRPAVCLD